MIENKVPEPSKEEIKRVVITANGRRTWEIEFNGSLSHRDLATMKRSLVAAFGKIQREKSLKRMLVRQEEERAEIAKLNVVAVTQNKVVDNGT